MRQIVLDTETTGIDPKEGHRLIEIGCVEMVNRRFTGRTYHQFINPEREIEAEAIEVHGITNQRVADEPRFAEVADEFWEFIRGAELVIHNAAFDVGFIDHEFGLLNDRRGEPRLGPVAEHCGILDTLKMARDKHPGQRNNLDALCKRYDIDNGRRVLHGALLDAEILAEVYLAMTGGQTALTLDASGEEEGGDAQAGTSGGIRRLSSARPRLAVVAPSEAELAAHRAKLEAIRQAAGECVWDRLEGGDVSS
ncbi:DNA polymerase III subunit epsilon [Halomonas pacifica]|uniref:DNA polymerase III subunit epsilon n=1 Tax=Bisbaumannia pacifica TaxID=77098 RepID=A0A510X3P9_9GAMM|nr:DNA polymerase III subunit epsilon [Halomonas pacifica]MBH8578729.1 DNA polymerase III subunit epsilon [Halomonas pacifica]MDC8804899.1 DNA polymerase III subunit epsilon [Halomonas pacifica]GEK46033.1 DNA polymerase III subunit epsilon [Halomonas pacifica]